MNSQALKAMRIRIGVLVLGLLYPSFAPGADATILHSGFYDSVWIKALCAAAVLAGLWAIHRIRLRRAVSQARQVLAQRLSEQERATLELHDTLVQSFQGIVLLFQTAADLVGENEPARNLMDQALQESDKVLVDGRERVMDLFACLDEDLAQAFSAAADELRKAFPSSYRIVVKGEPRELVPVLRDQVYRIGREAITNSFRHAHATEVQTEISYRPNGLRLLFRDNGDGINERILDAGAQDGRNGLMGMRERAKKMGAHLDIRSHLGSGTRIVLQVPAAIAYVIKPAHLLLSSE
jgi:signal transduction histidine kinase